MTEELKQELKRQRADIRRLKRMLRLYEKQDYLVDRVVGVVRDAIQSVPEIEVPKFDFDGDYENDETVVLHISDVHVGKKTKSYNPRVFEKRLSKLFENMMRVVTIQREVRPLANLVIVFNGDKQNCHLTPLIR